MLKEEIKFLILNAFKNCDTEIGGVISNNWIQTEIRDKLNQSNPEEINAAIKELVQEGKVVKNGSGFSLLLD